MLVNGYGATGYVRRGAVGAERAAAAARAGGCGFGPSSPSASAPRSADADGVALLTALALGERFRFTEQHWADFRRTGTSHLVAVSGMHVALLGVVVFVAAARASGCGCRRRSRATTSRSPPAASVLARRTTRRSRASRVPAQRSLVMIAIALAAAREPPPRRCVAQLVAATLLAVLVWDPFAPLSASFWLSFVAVAILLALAAPRPLARASPARAAARAARRAATFVRAAVVDRSRAAAAHGVVLRRDFRSSGRS